MAPPTYRMVKASEPADGVVLIKFNRPKSGNSVHPQLIADTLAAMRWADKLASCRVIILSGEGRFFSTGMELLERTETSFGLRGNFQELNHLLITSTKVLIAAVNGPAAGYGVSCLALFDLVYAVPHAYFFTPFVKWGMAPEGGSSFTFARIMGHQKAASLILAGERISADEAEKWGLVSKILPADNFIEEVVKTAARIAESPAGSLRTSKWLMREPVLQELLAANDRECYVIDTERIPSGEPEAAIKAFAVEQAKRRAAKTGHKL